MALFCVLMGSSQLGKESACNAGDPGSRSAEEGIGLPTPVFLSFPCGSGGEESTCNAGDLGLIPELGRSPEEGKGYPLQHSDLENSMGYSPRDHKVLDMIEQISLSHSHIHICTCILLYLIHTNNYVYISLYQAIVTN